MIKKSLQTRLLWVLAISGWVINLLMVAAHRELKKMIMPHQPSERVLLASAGGIFEVNGQMITIIKVRRENGDLALEVFGPPHDGQRAQLAQVVLRGRHDAYIHVAGQSTNLAITDLNRDQTMEIVAPTMTNELENRLNAYTLDAQMGLVPFEAPLDL